MPSLPLSPQMDTSPKSSSKKQQEEEDHSHKNLDTENKKEKKKNKKKRKTEEDKEQPIVDPTITTNGNSDSNIKKNKKKKVKLMDGSDEEKPEQEEQEDDDDPNSLDKFRISGPLRTMLESKGIKALFPIQAMTFDALLDGSDLVGRARTGQGKTLAFVLPIIESLVNGCTKAMRKSGYGRAPSVLVLLPTRELATQVFADFQVYGGAVGLTSCCVYGGSPFNSQIMSLKRGVDVVIGTPGRIKDLLEKGVLNLSSLLFRVLDEADEMLRMGFVEDVELILGKVEDLKRVQTLLFSATLPIWVKQISTKFLKSDKKTVDLVSDQKMKASTSVRHIAMPCFAAARAELIPDIIRCYSSGGRTIIFTETKESASQLAGSLPGARPLHGDIQQSQREVTLSGFRSGKFLTLVATNVAARGLDINDVQLIIQCEPPRDVEAYIHRSGRTGRAGNTGVAVMLYDPKKSGVSRIEQESGVKFEHLSAPQPLDVAKAAGIEAASFITQISDSVIPAFKDAAQDLLSNSGLSAVDLLAKALAKAAGYSSIKERSLLTGMEGYVTLLLESGSPMYSLTFAFNILRRFLPEENVEAVKGLAFTADQKGAVFDVPVNDMDTYLVGSDNAAGVSLQVIKTLPRLQERDNSKGRFGSSRGGFSRSGGSRVSGGGGGGYRNNGFSDRRSNNRFSNGFSRGRGRG